MMKIDKNRLRKLLKDFFIKKGYNILETDNGEKTLQIFRNKKDIDSIWDRFYKVDKARTREYGGSGIGLSIVKENIKNLKGKVNIENKIDGVLFSFSIPKEYQI